MVGAGRQDAGPGDGTLVSAGILSGAARYFVAVGLLDAAVAPATSVSGRSRYV